MLAAISSGVPDVDYAHDPITSGSANAGNLLALLDFSLGLLVDPQAMPSYQREYIEDFNKSDLFHRFALDNYAALYRLRKRRVQLAPTVDQMYRQALQALGGIAPLRDRLRALTKMRKHSPKMRI